jgi:alanine dehydrogenase
MKTILLSSSDVTAQLDLPEAIQVMETAFAGFARNGAVMPQRPLIPITEHQGICSVMLAYLKQEDVLGFKSISAFKENPERYGLPSLFGLVILLDPKTGYPLIIMEGAFLTGIRTAATSGLATKYLAREDARRLGVLGSGPQAMAQICAVCAVRPIETIRVYSPNLHRKKKMFLEKMAPLVDLSIELVNSPRQAVHECDIVVLATNSAEPVIDGDWIGPGTHINSVGTHMSHLREIDTKTVVGSKIIVDALEACLVEAGDILIPMAEGALSRQDIHGELGELVCAEINGRENDEETTLFKSVGLAFQDVAVAAHIYKRNVQNRLGSGFDFFK